MSRVEVAVMGRATVDLYANQIGAPLHQVESFTKYLGGCPANFAIGIARLGAKVGFIGKVGDEALGKFVLNALAEEGIDTNYLGVAKGTLTGLTLLEISPPDHFPFIYYRRECADLAVTREDVPAEMIRNSRLFFTAGTGLSGDPSFEATLFALDIAHRSTDVLSVFDIDYRASTWASLQHKITSRYRAALRSADVVIGTQQEIRVSTGIEGIDEAVHSIFSLGAAQIVIVKNGQEGSTVYTASTNIHQRAFPAKVMNVLGAGDGYAAGFCKGLLQSDSLRECARIGNAVGAIVVTRHSCASSMPHLAEVDELLARTDL